ncbi:family 43 glycosylhydrolase [Cellvibrio sp. UBA7671]|uniref:family 43 glycosylhydrolase n=1 Tax=Cellvibrio sp. UBA7671 TaxID=1946312 RepID=UPI002F358ABA
MYSVVRLFRYISTAIISAAAILAISFNVFAITFTGTTDIHDPSTIIKDGNTYWTFGTGGGASNFPINALYSTDLINWKRGASPIPANTYPSWISNKVPGFDGNFWAPDVIEMNGKFYLYYSAFSSTSGMRSAIGVMVTSSLNNPNWQDLGMIVSTVDEGTLNGQPVNAIDAGLYRDAQNNVWMVYGSHYAGIFVRQINPATGKLMNSTRYPVVGNNYAWHEYEAAQVKYINGYYYMFVNLGECCLGNQSNYYIVTGRSTSPTGPFLDKNGKSLWNYGGSTLLMSDGNYIGPGHFGYFYNNGQHLASIHYYDGSTANGWPARLDLLQMTFANGWPVFNRNFSIKSDGNARISGTYRITPAHSGKSLDVENCAVANGTNMRQWSWINNSCQKFIVTRVDDVWHRISPANASDKAFDVNSFSTADGANLMLWTYAGGHNQQFRFQSAGSGRYRIINRNSEKCLDIAGASTADGANLYQWQCVANSTNQMFTLQAQ